MVASMNPANEFKFHQVQPLQSRLGPAALPEYQYLYASSQKPEPNHRIVVLEGTRELYIYMQTGADLRLVDSLKSGSRPNCFHQINKD